MQYWLQTINKSNKTLLPGLPVAETGHGSGSRDSIVCYADT